MRRKTKITQEKINIVKTLIEKGVPLAVVSDVAGISKSAIYMIRRTGFNFSEYQKLASSWWLKAKQQKLAKPETTPSSSTSTTEMSDSNIVTSIMGIEIALRELIALEKEKLEYSKKRAEEKRNFWSR